MSITTLELSWVAGFLEGEGSFSWAGKNPRAQATQVDRWVLERLQRDFGGYIYEKKPYKAGWGKKICHSWTVGGPRAVGLMMTLYSMMSSWRQQQIQRVLERWRTSASMRGEKHPCVTVSDVIAKQAIQRVLDGESMTTVAKSLGLEHPTISMWVRGLNRPYLRQDVSGERAQWVKIRRPGMISDDAALEGVRRVRAGELHKDVAKDIGVTPEALGYWVRGEHRPYLLAALTRGEA